MSEYWIADWGEGEKWALVAPDGKVVGFYLSWLSAEAVRERLLLFAREDEK